MSGFANSLKQLASHIKDGEARLAYLRLLRQRSDVETGRHPADRTIGMIERNLEIARVQQYKLAHALTRELRLAKITQYMRRGALICQVIGRAPVTEVLAEHEIDLDEAIACVVLHSQQGDFRLAERWCVQGGGQTPATLEEAIKLLALWYELDCPAWNEPA